MFEHFQFTLIHGPNIPDSYAILFFTVLDFTSITSHIYNCILFLLWLHLFILSGVISPLFSSCLWVPTDLGSSSFSHIFLPFCTVHGVLKARILKWFAIPFSVDLIFSELSTMTSPSWVALHSMAHSFLDLDKVVDHVISLISFLGFMDQVKSCSYEEKKSLGCKKFILKYLYSSVY